MILGSYGVVDTQSFSFFFIAYQNLNQFTTKFKKQ